MKCLERNKVTIYYAVVTGSEEITDEYGNLTGEREVNYSNPCKLGANVSGAVGTAGTELFGVNANFTKTIVISDTTLPIDETTILWIDTMPVINEDGSTDTPYDYVVSTVPSRTLNGVAYGVKKVDVE